MALEEAVGSILRYSSFMNDQKSIQDQRQSSNPQQPLTSQAETFLENKRWGQPQRLLLTLSTPTCFQEVCILLSKKWRKWPYSYHLHIQIFLFCHNYFQYLNRAIQTLPNILLISVVYSSIFSIHCPLTRQLLKDSIWIHPLIDAHIHCGFVCTLKTPHKRHHAV